MSGESIRKAIVNGEMNIEPFYDKKRIACGMSYGLSTAGYDVRLSLNGLNLTNDEYIMQPNEFLLVTIQEKLLIPNFALALIKDKSSNVRKGLTVQNTVVEPGWAGYLTLELKNISNEFVSLIEGMPIAQLLFQKLDKSVAPYTGKYQNQEQLPVKYKNEHPRGE
jgi:dCTP deaminase